MKIIEGEFIGSPVTIIPRTGVLEIRARLMSAKSYQLPDDMENIELLSKEHYHSFEQWLIMVLLALTVLGLLIAIPLYFLGRKFRFSVRFDPKKGRSFVANGDGDDWKALTRYWRFS